MHFVKTEFLYISIIVLYLNTSFADIIAITTEKFEDTKGVIRRWNKIYLCGTYFWKKELYILYTTF
jgi:hypothetical protein